MLRTLAGVLLGRSTHSGHIYSPLSGEPYAVPGIDIYDFIQREEEHRATCDLDESLLQLEAVPRQYLLVSVTPIDLNLQLDPPPVQSVICVVRPAEKRRATLSAASKAAARVPPRVSPPPHPAGLPPPGGIIRIPRAAPTPSISAQTQKARKAVYHHSPLKPPPPYLSGLPTPGGTTALPATPPFPARSPPSQPAPRKGITGKRVQLSTPIFTTVDVSHLDHTTTSWTGICVPIPQASASLQQLQESGMDYLAWDGWCCRPFIDVKYRVFALLAGRPGPDQHGHDSYAAVIAEATALFSQQGINATGDGRRGPFTAVSAGKSYGGGQTRPGNLLNNRINQTICITMLTNWAIKHLAGFANGMFESFAPTLHAFYTEQMRLLHLAAPYLRRIFPESVSVFAACTFNFGPNTVTLPHVDAANLAWGWDLNLIIRFPPGSTILIPSALLRHSNIAIQQGETRYSFTQYTAGGLFRWVYNGNRADKTFYENATPEQVQQREASRAERWEKGLKMFMVWNPVTRLFEQGI
ncbi:hypothetical protein B0H13DRAFT_2303135 [Mycena leptocephala]|nr:hypothetical protein B0H13DRAFT_2303135 [Mycena leptocephala]